MALHRIFDKGRQNIIYLFSQGDLGPAVEGFQLNKDQLYSPAKGLRGNKKSIAVSVYIMFFAYCNIQYP